MVSVNEVLLEGIIVHKFVTPKIVILTINTGNSTPEPNYPKVLFFGNMIEKIDKNYDVKDHVKVVGNIQSSKYKPGIKNQNTISIFGESIEHSKSVMEKSFGVNDNHQYYSFHNEIKISGTIISIEKIYKNLVKLKVLTKKNDRISFVTLVHYTDDPESITNEFKVNDDVCAVGCVQTLKKKSKDEIHYFENYVANYIVKP